ncbi:MAG TPA: hypothetical protein VH762_10580 [Gemmatimonadaceae bacterium]|jgi:hypothetical protein
MMRSLGTERTLLRSLRGRRLVCAATVLLATTAASSLAAQPYRARVWLPAYPNVIALDTIAIRSEFPAPRLEVFQATAAVMEVELKIELKVRDSTAGVVGNLELVKMRSLGRTPLSRYVSCGQGMTGANADSYRVYLALIAFVDTVPDKGTRLSVALAAAAQDLQGSSKPPVKCGSTGALEGHIRRVVAARFGTVVK